MEVKYISLFAGIGGFDLALNRLGHECVWANEWDKYAAQIYNKNFEAKEKRIGKENTQGIRSGESESNNERNKGLEGSGTTVQQHIDGIADRQFIDTRDIRTVPTSEIPDHDLLVGGFPCQAFSIAGKRRGFDDTRGTLFFEIARILKDKQPKFFILENVKGLLSHDNGFTFKTIISTLTELGYDLQWQVLNSKNFGVPQNRERVFIVGHIRGQPRPEVFPITGGSKENNETHISKTLRSGYYKQRFGSQTINVVGTLETDGWEKRHEQIRRVHGIDGISPTIPTGTGGGVMTKVAIPYVRNPYNGKQSETETGTIGTSVGTSTGKTAQLLHKDLRIRRLTPTECERLQGFSDSFTKYGINEKGEDVVISDTQRYKVLGNAVTVNVVYEVARRMCTAS
jgi:DNA (cytosine-5)-methyltransferase 1